MAALTDQEIEAQVAQLHGWAYADGKLRASFEFADFVEAFGFMSKVAIVAEKLFHHPDWSNSWNRVDIAIVNHDAGGVSDQCFELATRIISRR